MDQLIVQNSDSLIKSAKKNPENEYKASPFKHVKWTELWSFPQFFSEETVVVRQQTNED